MSRPIFISFTRDDRKVAETICRALEGRGLQCWIATRDIDPGDNFQEAITHAIRAAKLMILVFSGHANNSLEVKKEVALAGRYGLVVVPVRVEDVVPNDAFAYEFAVRQWIDLFEDWEHSVEILVSRVAAVVNLDPATTGATTSPPMAPSSSRSANNEARLPRVDRRSLIIGVGTLMVLLLVMTGVAIFLYPPSRVAGPLNEPRAAPLAVASTAPLPSSPMSPAAAQPSAFVLCFSPSLNVLFHELSCGPDRTVPVAEAEAIRRRLADARSVDNSGQPFQVAPPGTLLRMSDGGEIKYIAADDMVVTTIAPNGKIMLLFSMFFEVTSQIRSQWSFDPREAQKIWPLAAGKQVVFVATRGDKSWRNTIRVLHRETISIPAGTFETYVVEREERGLTHHFDGVYTYWFAPSVGMIVKSSLRVVEGTAGAFAWEAQTISAPR
jgi:TIR domain